MHSIKFSLVWFFFLLDFFPRLPYCFPISHTSVNQLPVIPTIYKALICQYEITEHILILQLES